MTGFTSPLSQSYMDQEVRHIRRDPEWMACLAEVIGKIEDGFYGNDFQDTVFQQWERQSEITVDVAYPFALFYAALQKGEIARIRLAVYECPLSDSEVEENDRILQSALPKLGLLKDGDGNFLDCKWSGEFFGGVNGEDGFIKWEGTAKFETLKDGKNADFLYLPSGRLPLEVGTTSAAKTYLQLMNGGVARWPYHQKEITIYKLVRDAGPSYGNEQRNDSTLPGEKL